MLLPLSATRVSRIFCSELSSPRSLDSVNVDDHGGDVVFCFSLYRNCDQSVGGSLGFTFRNQHGFDLFRGEKF